MQKKKTAELMRTAFYQEQRKLQVKSSGSAVETCTLCGELHAGEEMEGTNNVLKSVEAYK